MHEILACHTNASLHPTFRGVRFLGLLLGLRRRLRSTLGPTLDLYRLGVLNERQEVVLVVLPQHGAALLACLDCGALVATGHCGEGLLSESRGVRRPELARQVVAALRHTLTRRAARAVE